MKFHIYFLLIIIQFLGINMPISAVAFEPNNVSLSVLHQSISIQKTTIDSPKIIKKMDLKKWLPLGLGILGIALIFVPYLSIIGLIAGIAAVIVGFLLRKQYPKTARWGIWLGGFCIVAFLSVLGLILFF